MGQKGGYGISKVVNFPRTKISLEENLRVDPMGPCETPNKASKSFVRGLLLGCCTKTKVGCR